MLNLQFTVHLSSNFRGNGVPLIIADLLALSEPVNLWLGDSVTAYFEGAVVVILDGLLLEGLGEDRLASCGKFEVKVMLVLC